MVRADGKWEKILSPPLTPEKCVYRKFGTGVGDLLLDPHVYHRAEQVNSDRPLNLLVFTDFIAPFDSGYLVGETGFIGREKSKFRFVLGGFPRFFLLRPDEHRLNGRLLLVLFSLIEQSERSSFE
jgi:hypothetical protein